MLVLARFGGQMPLPIFNANGFLPPVAGIDPADQDRSPYIVTMKELVETFGTSPRRRLLLKNLVSYRQLMWDAGYRSGLQFLDGSFVEDIEKHSGREPRDIDVFSLVNVPSRYIQDPALWAEGGFQFWEHEIQNQPLNKERFHLDTYASLVEDFPLLSDLLKNVLYWYSLFSHQRNTFAWKGFVAVVLDSAQDAEALVSLGER